MSATTTTKKNRRWLWYFVVVFALAIAATVILAVFNWQQQLRPEQLEAARKQWKEKGPRDYTMIYTIRRAGDDVTDRFEVKVRGGSAVKATHNGQPIPEDRLGYYRMERLFDYIERFMEMDAKKDAKRSYVRAIFDEPKTGGLRWYVRSVMGTRERAEITVEGFTID